MLSKVRTDPRLWCDTRTERMSGTLCGQIFRSKQGPAVKICHRYDRDSPKSTISKILLTKYLPGFAVISPVNQHRFREGTQNCFAKEVYWLSLLLRGDILLNNSCKPRLTKREAHFLGWKTQRTKQTTDNKTMLHEWH